MQVETFKFSLQFLNGIFTQLFAEALVEACARGYYEMVKLLLEKGFSQDLMHFSNNYSSRKGHCEVAEVVLERGAQVDVVSA